MSSSHLTASNQADDLQSINNTTLGTNAKSFPVVTLPNGERLPTGTVGALLVNIRAFDAGDEGTRAALEPAIRAAVPVLAKVGMFDLFTPDEWINNGGPGRALVGQVARARC
ncbi:hypothetical protein JDV02_008791 [Purpureocillium takamizusanense]|uniref:DUF7709 domain-containing protein n=1 Tax=Purpureocillium takamizusanense TaxID=2060973 RepID=A0A9Q8QMR5_9HYPO|nr:uncharacterized protein JDV02_008791 [Purpureocillium takamizusanense]UNI22948.1 hypothetical protein JDV02_008791 [Purpureocillium takamizusanense]